MSSAAEVESTLGAFVDPQFEKSLAQTKMLKSVAVEGSSATVQIELPTPAYPNQDQLKESIQAAVREKHGDLEQVNVEITSVVRGKDSGAKVGLKVKNVIAVGSGKGGVGKSTVASSLAYGLKHAGASVGLMDADVYGPSIPHLLGASGQPAMRQIQAPDGRTIERIVPIAVGWSPENVLT